MKSIKMTLAAAALAGSLQAQAAPVFYDSESAFLVAAAGYSLALEKFDSYKGAPTRNITNLTSGLNIFSNANLDLISHPAFCAASNCLMFNTPNGGSSQTFAFDIGGINAFGVFLDDLASVGATELTFTTDTGATQRYSFERSPGGKDRYFGVVDTAASFLSVTMTTSTRGDNVFIDNVRWGASNAVPEPGSLALVGLSLAGLAAARRRKA